MKYNKVVLAGGNGYLGTVLAGYYSPLAERVIILARTAAPNRGNIETCVWDGKTEGDWQQQLENADLLVNLCGKNVNCRYTKDNREAILQSRIIPTSLLGRAIRKLKHPPALWINIASATIYRHAEDRPQDEENGDIGYGFSVDICKAWEQTFFASETPATRKVALRMGIVIGRQDGAFPRLLGLVKSGLGGRQGNGQQYMSWIHEWDAARVTEWLLERNDLEGIFNVTAPEPVQNDVFMKEMRSAYGIAVGLPAPQWLLEIGTWLIGSETELLLKSRWVVPARLLKEGFNFHYPQAAQAIRDIMSIKG